MTEIEALKARIAALEARIALLEQGAHKHFGPAVAAPYPPVEPWFSPGNPYRMTCKNTSVLEPSGAP